MPRRGRHPTCSAGWPPSTSSSRTADQTGTFLIAGLAPGVYAVVAILQLRRPDGEPADPLDRAPESDAPRSGEPDDAENDEQDT